MHLINSQRRTLKTATETLTDRGPDLREEHSVAGEGKRWVCNHVWAKLKATKLIVWVTGL